MAKERDHRSKSDSAHNPFTFCLRDAVSANTIEINIEMPVFRYVSLEMIHLF